MHFQKMGIVLLTAVLLLSGCSLDLGGSLQIPGPGSTTDASAPTAPGTKLFSDPASGVSIAYPETWTIDQSSTALLVMFYTPLESDADTFQENVSIGMDSFPPGETVTTQKYAQLNVQSVKAMTDYKEISGGFVTRGSHEMFREEFTAKVEGEAGTFITLHWVQYYLVKDGVGYGITYTATPETAATYSAAVEQMAGTFTVK